MCTKAQPPDQSAPNQSHRQGESADVWGQEWSQVKLETDPDHLSRRKIWVAWRPCLFIEQVLQGFATRRHICLQLMSTIIAVKLLNGKELRSFSGTTIIMTKVSNSFSAKAVISMRKERKLSWHKASERWVKRHQGKVHYLGKGTPSSNGKGGKMDAKYDAALKRWAEIEDAYKALQFHIKREKHTAYLQSLENLPPTVKQSLGIEKQKEDLASGMSVEEVNRRAYDRDTIQILVQDGDAGNAQTNGDQFAQAIGYHLG